MPNDRLMVMRQAEAPKKIFLKTPSNASSATTNASLVTMPISSMIRKSATPITTSEIYLLPDEVCLAEAQYAVFELHCERNGFRFFDWGCIDINISCHIFLTDTRVNRPFPVADSSWYSSRSREKRKLRSRFVLK